MTYQSQNIASLIETVAYLEKTNDRKSNTKLTIFDKLATRLSYFFGSPNFYIPKSNLREEVRVASDSLKSKLSKVNRQTSCETEVSKVLIKIDLCFSFNQQILLQQLTQKLVSQNPSLSKYRFISPFMPVLHLNNDPIENHEIADGGSFHTDRDNQFGYKGSKVLWLPFTDYDYPGIATKKWLPRNFLHFLGPKFGFSIVSKCKSIAVSSRETHVAGDWILWSDVFPHGGLRNKTDKDAIALIVRFSKKKTKQTFIPMNTVLSGGLTSIDSNVWNELIADCKSCIAHLISILNDEKMKYEIVEESLDDFLKKIEQKIQGENSASLKASAIHILIYAIETMGSRIKSFPVILDTIHNDGLLMDGIHQKYLRLKMQLEKLLLEIS